MVRQLSAQQNRHYFLFHGHKRWSLLLCLFLLLHSSLLFAGVTASTNRTVLSIDETLSLEIKSENSSGDPDLTELENNFQILGRSQSQNYSLINGHASQTHIWSISLLPKKTGEITIPGIKVGNETTKPIHLVIQKQSSTPGIDGKKVFLKLVISGNEITDETAEAGTVKHFYVQQQILLSVKLYHRIRFSNASLSDLELTNTVVEKLGNDANYTQVVGNHRYNIIERHYAIYPQQSGELIIPPLTFSGNQEITQNFSLFSRPGRQIVSRTKPLSLNILPIPDTYTGKNWLPAEHLEIESEIVEDINSIVAGEAITRHIIVRAKGLLGSQLPVTTVQSTANIKTYPDKEKLSNQLVDGKVIGVRHDTIAIIPLKSGPFTLPEIKIDWWNTKTNQQETARLAAQTFVAQRNSEQLTSDKPVNPVDKRSTTQPDKNQLSESQNTKTIEKIVYTPMTLSQNIWFWISIALLLIWLITLILYLSALAQKKHLTQATNKSDQLASPQHNKNYLQAVYTACQENNAGKAMQSLIKWARIYYQQPMLSGLSDIIQLIDDEHLINAINTLESSQYSQDKHNWDGNTLTVALQHYIAQNSQQAKHKANNIQALSTLNP